MEKTQKVSVGQNTETKETKKDQQGEDYFADFDFAGLEVSMQKMLKSGVHFGHQKSRKIVIDHSWSVSDNDMIMRNSLDNIFTWKQRLSPTEIDYIRENVSDISQYYYSDEDWG